ncbi:hypothetical protein SPBR_08161 [Sporothrix brasiliensis 5110]|uniref:ATPase synthesis protein 25 n=1 Tax=Sporothrix brasiliensis 5110 TaxID=1398154 RepID=A0A0C2INC2_9PEZI|nr:uncharacterized protein SPBR_08161 [Sporothrix brasiliensis 5110]KIH86527.1 hypothetical protein SPBR_08161 [Sporothrix brasiliensis 5110]
MLQPTVRATGSVASRAKLQRVLQIAAPASCRSALEASSHTRPSRPQTALVRRPGQSARPARPAQLSQVRWLSVSRPVRNKDDEDVEGATQTSLSDETKGTPSIPSTPSATPPDNIPWYLKVDVPKHATLAPHDVPLPDIPPHSPALLTPLLSFAADDLGLDDLALLDLRALDPPAALGPDLLMLFGSARSERHLHVSADRLVRWLRKHGVHATADGLLGRNELKIKLRRKARRAKLLGTSGTSGASGMAQLDAASRGEDAAAHVVDDGISTQWVCLHAGTLGRSADEGSTLDAAGRTSGFGALRSPGTTVVVQMFTDAKRKQLDLEALWSRTLVRSVKARVAAGEALPEYTLAAAEAAEARSGKETDTKDGAETGFEDVSVQSTVQSAAASSSGAPSSSFGGQHRYFSTSARRRATLERENAGQSSPDVDIVSRLTQPWIGASDVAKLGARLAQDAAGKAQLQKQLIRYLDSLGQPDAVHALGAVQPHGRGRPTSDFITASAVCMRDVPPAETWALRAHVHARALILRHGGYDLAGLVELIREMQQGGLPVDRALCAQLLQALFTPQADETREPSVAVSAGAVPSAEETAREAALLDLRKETALGLLNTMYERGQETIARDVIVAMIAALARHNGVARARATAHAVFAEKLKQARYRVAAAPAHLDRDGNRRFQAVNDVPRGLDVADATDARDADNRAVGASAAAQAADDLQTTLEALLHQAELPCLEDAQIITLLGAYADAEDWARFWALWRMPPQHGLSRSQTLYIYVFRRMAETGHKALCIDTVRRCFHEMMHEQVPVHPKAAVYNALAQCIKVADPGAEAIARNLPDVRLEMTRDQIKRSRREFVKLLRMVER